MTVSFRQVPNFKGDIAAIVREVFDPENVVLDSYGFLGWVRAGLSAGLTVLPDTATARPKMTASVDVVGADGLRKTADWSLTLAGPGDVIGIDRQQIIRRFPAPGSSDVEATRLAHVEFDRPELPWLFSPFPVDENGRLVPWIALVVIDAAAVDISEGQPGFPRRLVVDGDQLPDPADCWAFAHAQVKGEPGGPTADGLKTRLSDAYGPQNLSRLICPRQLEAGRDYVACVVPLFKAGAKRGLGVAASDADRGTDFAWGGGGQVELPVYDEWSFRMGEADDFEALASRLKGIVPPPGVGRRVVDLHAPGSGLIVPAGDPGRMQELRTALYAPAAADEARDPDWSAPVRAELAAKVAPPGTAVGSPLPRVSPRLYARFQRGRRTLPHAPPAADGDWFVDLNTRPLDRIAAGIGTRVVQRDQEKLMEAAWAQVGEIRKANAALNRIKLGRFVAERYHGMLAKLPVDRLTQVTRPMHGKIWQGQARTLHAVVAESRVAQAALTPAFRRMTILRAQLAGIEPAKLDGLVAGAGGFRDFRRTAGDLSGITGLKPEAIKDYGELIGGRLGVPVEQVTQELIERRMTVKRTAADKMLDPVERWTLKARGSVSVSERADAQALAAVQKTFASVGRQAPPPAFEALAGTLLALSSGSGATARAASAQLTALATKLPPAAQPLRRGPKKVGLPKGVELGGSVPRRLPPGELPTDLRKFERFGTATSKDWVVKRKAAGAKTVASVAKGLAAITGGIGLGKLPQYGAAPALSIDKTQLLATIEPKVAARNYALARFGGTMTAGVASDWLDDFLFTPVMAAPRFDRPMYEAIADYDRNWLVPGLSDVRETDFVTLLATNPRFIEAFMVGLSDEMGRELLWRDYPTDQRGTYFHRFWRPDADEIGDIHRFSRIKTIGAHFGGGDVLGPAGEPLVVMVVRGEVIRRYPDAQFLLVKGKRPPEAVFEDPPAPGEVGSVLFHAPLEPDILCIGFNLTVKQLMAPGANWWCVIAEHPTAPRFGLDAGGPAFDEGGAARTIQRNDLGWRSLPRHGAFLSSRPGPTVVDGGTTLPGGGVPKAPWPTDAGWVAQSLFQNPMRVMFFAEDLLANV